MTKVVVSRQTKRALLFFAPFFLIAAIIAGTDVLAMHRAAAVRTETEEIVLNMLASIELVSRMRRDVDQVKLNTDQHILEKEAHSMAALEARIRAAEADCAAAGVAYDPLTTLPDEAATWTELKREFAQLQPPLDATLAMSRANDDEGARAAFDRLGANFTTIDQHLLRLAQINHDAARDTMQRVDTLQRTSTALLRVLAVGGICLTILVGAATARLALRREQLQRHYTEVLEARNRELDAFAGRVAHDLRGPLSTATLATAQLSRKAPEHARMTDVLGRSFARMEALIQDLLAIARTQTIEQGAVCDPATAAAQLREELTPRLEGGDVNLLIEVESARVRCTEGLLRQLMWNLADNAIKYRRPEVRAQVEIRGHAQSDHYELYVRDNGLGMSPEEASRAFEPFYRASGGKGPPGIGLGLSIVKRVAEVSGGTVSVSSERGRGSTFVANLPLG
jgi:signal transduction histidine kinase